MKLKVILTGATGMVGEGVLHECLQHPDVEKVLVVGRRSCGIVHPKLQEIIHPNMQDISPMAEQLKGYNACFFCLGVSSVGISKEAYYALTYTLTLNFATVLSRQNPDLTFCYVSGRSTDSTEKGWQNWARVKGKTENDLQKLPFKRVYNFRPGYLHPTPGLKNTQPAYKYITWLYPVLRTAFPKFAGTLKELGQAMIQAASKGYPKPVLELDDIKALANR